MMDRIRKAWNAAVDSVGLHSWNCGDRCWHVPALVTSARYMVALLIPFWDGDAPGRAYTSRERRERRARQLRQLRQH
jgi:hypothetical protein